MTLTFDLDLERFDQGQKFGNQLRRTSQNSVGEVKGQGEGRAKGQIHLISYNSLSNYHRDFKLDSCFSL